MDMGVPGSWTNDAFHEWAQLRTSREEFVQELREEQQRHFLECMPMPGAEKLLLNLKNGRTTNNKVEIALASSSEKYNYDRKVSRLETKELLRHFNEDRMVQHGRGKPAPDIYLLALRIINSNLHGSSKEITPEECLVFEDSVPGVEAGRRAGMRVVWVPHPDLAAEYKGRKS